MDILKTVREIGFFETGCNVTRVMENNALSEIIGRSMPLPDETLVNSLESLSQWLIGLGKTKFLFLNPEIAVIERLVCNAFYDMEAIIVVPVDMDNETRERISDNLPQSVKVSTLSEPYFPNAFFPCNGVIVASGYLAANRPMVLPETYRLIDHYWGFKGKRVFIPYVAIPMPVPYEEWIEIDARKFNRIWPDDGSLLVQLRVQST